MCIEIEHLKKDAKDICKLVVASNKANVTRVTKS